jgi:excinuclease UvrABC nuclease subunit
MKTLEKEYIISRSFPKPDVFGGGCPKSGVYFLIRAGEIVYIGKSVNLRGRLNTHRREKDFDRVYILECDGDFHLSIHEYNHIRKFRPVLNIPLNPDKRKFNVRGFGI